MAEIYGLYSAQDGIVRYVGQTSGTRDVRFKEHKRDAEGPWTMPHLCRWFHREWKCGFLIECALLQCCDYAERRRIETEWIRRFPNLLNERKVRYWWPPDHKPPTIPEIKKYIRRHIFNAGGFRGIQYWKEIDRYSVLVYNGGEPEWLLGDAMPGGGGNIYFSDRTEALKARDKYRQGRQRNWLPDIEQEMEW